MQEYQKKFDRIDRQSNATQLRITGIRTVTIRIVASSLYYRQGSLSLCSSSQTISGVLLEVSSASISQLFHISTVNLYSVP
jgi:hypothetical protein